jgi:hypothetical protein
MSPRATLLTAVLGAVLALGLAAAVLDARRQSATPASPRRVIDVHSPAGERIRVQVLNATSTRGLGRRAMLYLRDRGFDVVEVGTSRRTQDSTLVLDRSRHPEWARRVAKALGGARVKARPDSSRYLDVTVILGTTWRPPAEPFRP